MMATFDELARAVFDDAETPAEMYARQLAEDREVEIAIANEPGLEDEFADEQTSGRGTRVTWIVGVCRECGRKRRIRTRYGMCGSCLIDENG